MVWIAGSWVEGAAESVSNPVTSNPVLGAATYLTVFYDPKNKGTMEDLRKNLPPTAFAQLSAVLEEKNRELRSDRRTGRKAIAHPALVATLRSTLREMGFSTKGLPLSTNAPPPGEDLPPPSPFPGIEDQPASPVFGRPSIGSGSVILGIGAGASEVGGTEWSTVLKDLAKKEIARHPFDILKDRPKRAPLPKTGVQKIVRGAIGLLGKIPKGAIPTFEGIGRIAAGKTLIGIASQVAGEYAIQKIASVVADRQFSQMTKILGSQDAAAVAARQRAARGPKTRPRVRPARIEEPRPSVPPEIHGNVVTARPPSASVAVKPAPSPIDEITVTAQKITHAPVVFATPGVMKVPIGQKIMSQIKRAIPKIADLSSIYRASKSSTSTRSNFSPGVRASPSPKTNPFRAQEPPTGKETCYTVCRKPPGQRKKRKKNRVCVSQSQAKKFGLAI